MYIIFVIDLMKNIWRKKLIRKKLEDKIEAVFYKKKQRAGNREKIKLEDQSRKSSILQIRIP